MVFSSDFEERSEQIPDYVEEIKDVFDDAIMRVVDAADRLYLDGVSIFDVVRHCFLTEMNDVLGHGLCYEAAALAMMLLRDNPTARLALGTAENCYKTRERCDHAWVEFEEKQVPFVVDFTWFKDNFCIPRIVHVDICRSIIYHTYTYEEFWQISMSQRLYALIHERKTSYVLPWLFLYRAEGGEYALNLTELSEKISKSSVAPTGEYRQYMYFWDHIMERFTDFTPAELKYVAT